MLIQLSDSFSDQLAELIVQRVTAAVRLRVGVNPAAQIMGNFSPDVFSRTFSNPKHSAGNFSGHCRRTNFSQKNPPKTNPVHFPGLLPLENSPRGQFPTGHSP